MSKTALVTGSSRGIGKEIALKLGKLGYKVVVNYLSNVEAAEEVVKEITNGGGQAIALRADVSNIQDLEKLVNETKKAFGSLDVLINNAGITRDNLLIRMSLEDWEAVIQTNLIGIMHLSELAFTEMKKQGAGKIINITSVVGVHGNAGQVNYAAAKSALISFTKIKARELMPIIQVNAIAPGLVETDMTAQFDLKKLSQTKLGRVANPKDIAECVAWLIEPSGDYVTGQIIEVDGGLSLWSNVQELVN